MALFLLAVWSAMYRILDGLTLLYHWLNAKVTVGHNCDLLGALSRTRDTLPIRGLEGIIAVAFSPLPLKWLQTIAITMIPNIAYIFLFLPFSSTGSQQLGKPARSGEPPRCLSFDNPTRHKNRSPACSSLEDLTI